MEENEAYFARGQDNIHELVEQLSFLTSNGGRWNLTLEGKGLERSFHFDSFRKSRVSDR